MSSIRKIASIHSQRLESGQSLVEVAFGMVILLVLLAGVLDLGRMYFTFVALEDSVGEAALYLAINPLCPDASSGPDCADPNNAEFRARHAGGSVVDWTQTTIKFDIPTDSSGTPITSVGEPVSVTLEYPYYLITPIIPRIAGVNPLTLSTHASQIIIGE